MRSWDDIKEDITSQKWLLSREEAGLKEDRSLLYRGNVGQVVRDRINARGFVIESYKSKIAALEDELRTAYPLQYWDEKTRCPDCGGNTDSLGIKCVSCGKMLVSEHEAQLRREEEGLCRHCGGAADSLGIQCVSCGVMLIPEEDAERLREEAGLCACGGKLSSFGRKCKSCGKSYKY